MKIRNKILLYFSTTIIILAALTLSAIYILFAEYREEEFQERMNEKVNYSIELIGDYQVRNRELLDLIDKQNIHDFYDEKLLVFDSKKELVFSSIDDLPIKSANEITNQLSPSNRWIETKDGDYDLIGVYIEKNKEAFYAVLKAYDEFGYSKLQYLRNVLIIIFIVIAGIMILGSLFLANIISKPITALADQMKKININKTHFELSNTRTTSTEIDYLQEQFKELLTRTHESFVFHKNAVQHISHELKTPIAVLVSELERIKNISSDVKLHEQLGEQVCRAKSLGDIINTLLEISKVEAGQATIQKDVRMDECLFDIMDELKVLYTDFSFELQYKPDSFKESDLIIKANEQLLKQALLNKLLNAIRYSNNKKAQITIDCTNYHSLKIDITNSGKTLAPEEVKFLFQHFFRGANSKQHSGFGLGLVLSQKIIILHNGNISYAAPTPGLNVFSIEFEKQNHTL